MKVYAIKTLVFEGKKPVESDEVVAVLRHHAARPGMDDAKTYVTALVKVSD